jgi:eukaryotic-like serine/threonine-protein kinase
VSQDPPAGTAVVEGSTVKVEVVSGKELVQVPELVGVPEADAVRALLDAKLEPGLRTDSFDPAVPAGSVIGTSIPAGTEVPTGTAIDYEVSKGPEPTPSPTPTAAPTPTPTPAPTPTPVPTVTVGTYVGQPVSVARDQATSEGLIIKWQGGTPADTDVITSQNPGAGAQVPVGSTILLTAKAPATPTPAPTPTVSAAP